MINNRGVHILTPIQEELDDLERAGFIKKKFDKWGKPKEGKINELVEKSLLDATIRDEMPDCDPGFGNFQKRAIEYGAREILDLNKVASDYQVPAEVLKKEFCKEYSSVKMMAFYRSQTKTMNRAQLKAIIFNTTGKMPAWYLPKWILRKRARGILE